MRGASNETVLAPVIVIGGVIVIGLVEVEVGVIGCLVEALL